MMESIQASAVVQVRSHVDIATRSMYDVVYDGVRGSEALIFLKPWLPQKTLLVAVRTATMEVTTNTWVVVLLTHIVDIL